MLRNLFLPQSRDLLNVKKDDGAFWAILGLLLIAAMCAPVSAVKKKSRGWPVFWVFGVIVIGLLALSYFTHGTWINS